MSLSNGETEENLTGVTPWNENYQKAHAGDIEAEYSIYMAADPFIERLCNVPYFRDRLGKDEIRSICSFALVKWVRKEQQLPPDEEVPFLLRSVLRKTLLCCIRRQDFRAALRARKSCLRGWKTTARPWSLPSPTATAACPTSSFPGAG